jgi:hypothetical protein
MIIENLYISILAGLIYIADLNTGCYIRQTKITENIDYVEDSCNTNYYIINGEVGEDNTSKIRVEYD